MLMSLWEGKVIEADGEVGNTGFDSDSDCDCLWVDILVDEGKAILYRGQVGDRDSLKR
jgi:hypothetical protein